MKTFEFIFAGVVAIVISFAILSLIVVITYGLSKKEENLSNKALMNCLNPPHAIALKIEGQDREILITCKEWKE